MKLKSKKSALVLSFVSVMLCVAMLVGSTFAWFTDTASANVNRIQSGNLKVGLQMKDSNGEWVDATTETLNFKTYDGRTENILWEPGCTYELPELRVVNDGNLALKYKLEITGITGDAELNDVIDWTVTLDGADYVLGSEHSLAAKNGETVDADVLTIKGHMQETAGNEYKAKSIENISITVYATQDTVENDSYGNTYDANADGTPQFDTWYENSATTGDVSTENDTVIKDRETDPTIQAVIPAESTTADKLTLIKNKTDFPGNFTVETGTEAASVDVKLVDQSGNKVTAEGGKFFTLTMQLDKGKNVIGFYHNDMPLTKAASADLTGNDMYYYDATTGLVTFTTDDFSIFTVIVSNSAFNGGEGTEAAPYLIATGDQAYGMRNADGGYFKLVEDVVVTNEIYLSGKTYVLDLNGHSLKLEYAADKKANNGGVLNVSGKKGNLTINDSSANESGKVFGSGQSYANKVTSAVRVGNYGTLTINGGHFYGTSAETSCIYVCTSTASGTKATVTINGGKFETTAASNGTYYVLNHQDGATTDCTITVNGGSFKNYNPGVTEVDPVNAKTGKIALGDGCTTTSETVGSDTWYTVSK